VKIANYKQYTITKLRTKIKLLVTKLLCLATVYLEAAVACMMEKR
jgi:hypothetical protein